MTTDGFRRSRRGNGAGWIAARGCFAMAMVVAVVAGDAVAQQADRPRPGRRRPAGPRVEPTHADVAYGQHPQQRIDLYLAKSETPTPLVLYIHGGGFRGGSKRSVDPRPFLAAGISLAAIEYRLVQHKPLPAAHHDCRRAIQFLRHHAKDYNIDKSRIGAFGGSAGAQLSMYLGFHDDMADPDSDDPIARESTRLTCVATSGNARGWKVHHVIFGIHLKEKMDPLGIECHLRYPGARTEYASREQFLIAKLTSGSERD